MAESAKEGDFEFTCPACERTVTKNIDAVLAEPMDKCACGAILNFHEFNNGVRQAVENMERVLKECSFKVEINLF